MGLNKLGFEAKCDGCGATIVPATGVCSRIKMHTLVRAAGGQVGRVPKKATGEGKLWCANCVASKTKKKGAPLDPTGEIPLPKDPPTA